MKRALAVITAILVSILWLGLLVGVPVLAFTGQLWRWIPAEPVQQLFDQSGIDAETLSGIVPAELLALLPATTVEEQPTVVIVEEPTPTPEPPTPTPPLPTNTPTVEPTPFPVETPTPEAEDEVDATDLITDTETLTSTVDITDTVQLTTTQELTTTEELTSTVELTLTTPQTATVANIANLRSGPGIDFDIVGTVDANTVVSIVGRDETGEWYQLEDETWISGIIFAEAPNVPVVVTATEETPSAVTTPSAETPTVAQIQTITTTVTADTNLRAGPGTTYNISSTLSAGSVITLAARNLVSTWYLLDTGNWVSATLLAAAPEGLPVVNERGIILTGPNAGQSVLSAQPTSIATPEATPAATPAATPEVAPATTPTPAVQPTTNADANLRSGPGLNTNIVGSAPLNTALDIVGRNEAGDWFRLADGSWIFAQLVSNPPTNLPVVTTP